MTELPQQPCRAAVIVRPIRVVLVEDHDRVRDLVAGHLQAAGIEVLDAVATVRDGYRSVIDHQPDVVVLDNHLPDGLGIDLCRALTRQRPDLTVIVYSAHLTQDDHELARQAGATTVVPKTFTNRELLTAITTNAGRPDSPRNAPAQQKRWSTQPDLHGSSSVAGAGSGT